MRINFVRLFFDLLLHLFFFLSLGVFRNRCFVLLPFFLLALFALTQYLACLGFIFLQGHITRNTLTCRILPLWEYKPSVKILAINKIWIFIFPFLLEVRLIWIVVDCLVKIMNFLGG